MPEKLLFLTGKLAEKSLHKVLAEMQPTPFDYQIEPLGISVAALMTPEFIARRLSGVYGADRVLVPGLCRGDLNPLSEKYGVPVQLGPEDLKDLPEYFGRGGKKPDLSRHNVRIFAEIVEAPQLDVEAILTRAGRYRVQGADVIDLGCLPNTPFPHLEEAVQTLKAAGFAVSVDSLDTEDLLRGGKAGADYLLSLTEKTLWVADEVAATPVLIPARTGSLPSLYRAIEGMMKKGRDFLADPILDPIPFGLAQSVVRYHRLRKKYPDIPVMMGVGNLTELTDADTTGINAILFGIIAELDINAVLTTSVSPHARNAVQEADLARRLMYAARQDSRLPRDYSNGLLGLHDRKPFPYGEAEIADFAALVKDPNFRIQVSAQGVSIYNRAGLHTDTDPFRLYPKLGVENDASHAFYLGVELARAQIAWQLGKRYVQDEELEWGCGGPEPDARGRVAHRDSAVAKKSAKSKAREGKG
ncbi:MAG: dihydropteroate synthase [Methylobacterium sp.]|nr:dihydropteroate synthase [Methylobacterium sp.]